MAFVGVNFADMNDNHFKKLGFDEIGNAGDF